MISWLHNSGILGWWKYSAYLSAFLPGERTPRCALARSNLIYICTSYICLHTGDSTTPLVSSTGKPSTLRRDQQTESLSGLRSVLAIPQTAIFSCPQYVD